MATVKQYAEALPMGAVIEIVRGECPGVVTAFHKREEEEMLEPYEHSDTQMSESEYFQVRNRNVDKVIAILALEKTIFYRMYLTPIQEAPRYIIRDKTPEELKKYPPRAPMPHEQPYCSWGIEK